MLEIKNLSISYSGKPAVRQVSFAVQENETVCLVGESGSGKSTIVKAVTGLLSSEGRIVEGEVFFDGMALHTFSEKELRQIRGRQIAMIYQNAGRSLDPVMKIGKQFYEMLCTKEKCSRKQSDQKAAACMRQLSLRDPEKILKSYPSMLSGGMNQRVAIAMAMVMEPRLILADEPTSAQDVTVQAELIQALKKLKETTKASLLLVTHSMGVVARMADKVGVMCRGCLVEWGHPEQILNHPVHPYTRELIGAILHLDGRMPETEKRDWSLSEHIWTETEPGHFAAWGKREEKNG